MGNEFVLGHVTFNAPEGPPLQTSKGEFWTEELGKCLHHQRFLLGVKAQFGYKLIIWYQYKENNIIYFPGKAVLIQELLYELIRA